MREHRRALRHSVHIAGETKLPQIFQEALLKQRRAVIPGQGAQIAHVLLRKTQFAQPRDRIRQTRRHRVAAREGSASKKQVKHGLFPMRAGLPITVCHRQLVEVGQQRRSAQA